MFIFESKNCVNFLCRLMKYDYIFHLKIDGDYWKSVNELKLVCTPKHIAELPGSL